MTDGQAVPESEYMRIKKAALYLDCSPWLLWKKLTSGELKRYKLNGTGLTYVRRSELDGLMQQAK
jgi:hypothetical protein